MPMVEVELEKAGTGDVAKAIGLSAVSSAIGVYAVGNYSSMKSGVALSPGGKLVSILAPAAAKLLAVQMGLVKGEKQKDIVKNSVVVDLAMAYGSYFLPKIEEAAITGKFPMTFPKSERFGQFERSNVGGQISALQRQLSVLEAPRARAETVVTPAIARIEADRTANLIG